MRLPAAMVTAVGLVAPACADQGAPPRVAPPIVYEVAPALGAYTDGVLFGDLWKRPDLAPRDRSIVTIAALIAQGQTAQMPGHFGRALDNGVKPSEIAAIITQLAFYSGWPRAMSAVGVAKDVFAQRGIGLDQLAPGSSGPVGVDAASEAQRAAAVEAQAGGIAPALADYTNTVLFGDLWRRTDLAPKDRSLVTIVALIATGQVDQLAFHMARGIDNGLTRTELSEVITHLAFYAGWPRAMSALPVAKAVFDARASSEGSRATLQIQRRGALPSVQGLADNFTGTVKIESRFQRDQPARVGGGIVSFEPGARTAWHSHPLGQTLIVTSGCGWVQQEGGAREEMRSGDVVWIPPGVKHWHGATATTAMTHVAIAEALDGKSVAWMEQVSDAQYGRDVRKPDGC
jgi:4-carboxymuconolactone decarboxylase